MLAWRDGTGLHFRCDPNNWQSEIRERSALMGHQRKLIIPLSIPSCSHSFVHSTFPPPLLYFLPCLVLDRKKIPGRASMYSFLGKQSDSNLSVFEAISNVSSSASHRPSWPYANLFFLSSHLPHTQKVKLERSITPTATTDRRVGAGYLHWVLYMDCLM